MAPTTVAVLASGRGTDFQALVDAMEAGTLGARVVLLVCNVPGAPVIDRAKRHGIATVVIDHRGRAREAFEDEVLDALRRNDIDLVVLAGFMRLLSPHFLRIFPGRVMNIHPSLLPAFPGAHAQADALAHGVRVSGCTVHFVDESLDGGPIILQRAVAVEPDDTVASLSTKILGAEHEVLPLAVKLFAEGRLRLEGRRVTIDARGLPHDLIAGIGYPSKGRRSEK